VAVDRDIACVSCNYNLRGLEPDGRCPECGAAVQLTLDDRLVPVPPQALDALRTGLTGVRRAFAIGIVTVFVAGFGLGLLEEVVSLGPWRRAPLALVIMGFWSWAIWRLVRCTAWQPPPVRLWARATRNAGVLWLAVLVVGISVWPTAVAWEGVRSGALAILLICWSRYALYVGRQIRLDRFGLHELRWIPIAIVILYGCVGAYDVIVASKRDYHEPSLLLADFLLLVVVVVNAGRLRRRLNQVVSLHAVE
jgi:hypothetical protein